jgi:hypothetical protein
MIIKTDIREKAMTVQFSSKCWTARKFDKAATAKHNQSQGADADASRINNPRRVRLTVECRRCKDSQGHNL